MGKRGVARNAVATRNDFPSFIDSPFSTKREYEQYLALQEPTLQNRTTAKVRMRGQVFCQRSAILEVTLPSS